MLTLRRLSYLVGLALLVYMPLHIFLSQSLSQLTGGLDAWKIGKDIVLCTAVLFTICLVFWQRRGDRVFLWLLGAAAVYGGLHIVLWLLHPDLYARSAALGIMYNMRLPLGIVLGYGAVLLLPKFVFSSVIKVILSISTIVAVLGLVQFILPGDILTHAGYSLERGARAVFYIDDNQSLPHRIMSTLREPNALGAYLIVPAAALAVLFLKVRSSSQQYMLAGLLAIHVLAIFLTFSRSAWLALAVTMCLVAWWQYKNWLLSFIRRFWPVVTVLLLVCGTVLFSMRDTAFFQQYVIHSNPAEQVEDLDSNDYHTLLVRQGIQGIINEPFGHGPGTAGLASIQNPHGGQLTENYYVQIGYELGIVGLVLFIAAQAWIYWRLHKRHDYIGVILCASFWGYVVTNMLLHTWSNEAVALQWWLLAGYALAAGSIAKQVPHK